MKQHRWWIAAGTLVFALFLPPLLLPDYRALVESLLTTHPYAAPLIVSVLRFVFVVIAPLPASPLIFVSIAFMPWWQAALFNYIGTTAGAVAAFFIARRWREPVVARFTPLKDIHAWQDRISRRRQFWAFLGLRFSTLMVFDYVSYMAGLTKMPFRTFLAALIIVDIPVHLVFFYLGGIAARYGIAIFLFFGVLFLTVLPLVKNATAASQRG